LYDQLDVHNEGYRVMILLQDNDTVIGGISAYLYLGIARIEVLWVNELYQRQGYGTQLLKKLETECLTHQCNQLIVDTYTFQAPLFYPKFDYQLLYQLRISETIQRLSFNKKL